MSRKIQNGDDATSWKNFLPKGGERYYNTRSNSNGEVIECFESSIHYYSSFAILPLPKKNPLDPAEIRPTILYLPTAIKGWSIVFTSHDNHRDKSITSIMTPSNSTNEATWLLPHHGTVQPQRGEINTSTSRSVKKNVLAFKMIAVLSSIGLMAWIGISSMVGSSSVPTAASVTSRNDRGPSDSWNDAVLYRWEDFLHEHAQELTSDLSIMFKSAAKKEAHKEKKVDKKENKMKVKAESHFSDDAGLLYLNNSQTFHLLRHGDYDPAVDFFYYQNGWEAQLNQAYCAVATSAAVLNSYRGKISLPHDPVFDPFPWATQEALVHDGCVQQAVADVDVVAKCGLGIGMVPGLLNCFLEPQGYQAVAHPMDPAVMTVEDMRALVTAALLDDDSRVVLNYDRGGIGQGPTGHGHWSPIGAYSVETDSFLIMDVAKYKFPPVFVPSAVLFGGVATLDGCASMMPSGPIDWQSEDFTVIGRQLGCQPGYRGFVVVKPIK